MIGEALHKVMELNYKDEQRVGIGMSQLPYCELQTQRLYDEGAQKQIGTGNLLAMRTGVATHAELFRLLWNYRGKLEGFTYKKHEVEVMLTTPAGNVLVGHFDLLAEINGRLEIIDLKVVDEAPWNYIDGPREHEKDQVMLYCAAHGVETGRLVYLCKGGRGKGQVKEYAFEVDKDRIGQLLAKYDRILARKAVKPFDAPTDSWQCSYCGYYEDCWGKKTFASKVDEVAEIPVELEMAYIAAKANEDQAHGDAEEIKQQIIELLHGRRGEGDALSALYITPKPRESLDTAALKKEVSAEVIKKCTRVTPSTPYYKLNIRGEK